MRTLRVTRNDEEEEGLTIERLIERRENKRDHPSTSNSLFSLYNSAEDSPRATIFAGIRSLNVFHPPSNFCYYSFILFFYSVI